MRVIEISSYSATLQFTPRDLEIIARVLDCVSLPEQVEDALPENHPVAQQDFLAAHVQTLAVVFRLAGGWTELQGSMDKDREVPSYTTIQAYQDRYFRQSMGVETEPMEGGAE